jgi:hypothetical protein
VGGPNARDASLYSRGIDLKASSETLTMMGKIITVRITDAVNILNPVPPNCNLINGTNNTSPKNP